MLSIENQNKLHDAAAYIANVRLALRGVTYKTQNGGEFTDLEAAGLEMTLGLAIEIIDSIEM